MTKHMQEWKLKVEGNAVQIVKCCKYQNIDKSVFLLMIERVFILCFTLRGHRSHGPYVWGISCFLDMIAYEHWSPVKY